MTAEAKGAAKKQSRIVIVDDDEDLLKLMVFSFEAQGFQVHTMSTGKEALAFFANEKNMNDVVLVILDRILPDLDGIEILKKFIEKYNHSVPAILLSVLSSEKDVLTGYKHGAVEYITKPFNLPVLIGQAEALIARSH